MTRNNDALPLIRQIVARAKATDPDTDTLSLEMDLFYLDVPLDHQKLLNAPDFDFWHDIGGIQRHFNRREYRLENHFYPRCAA